MTDAQPPLDWRSLGAGRALDRIVAEALGWRVANHQWKVGGLVVENDMTRNVVMPSYSTDANAALSLVNGEDEFCLWLGVKWCATFDPKCDVQNAPDPELCERAETPALALCRAWLAWRERNK